MFRSLYERLLSIFYPRDWYASSDDAGEWVWKRYDPATRSWETRPMSPDEAEEAAMMKAIR
ncbi:hypothetical protein PLCT1_02478 [Planctomycetaceae bacterium]|nr:hypothetical protein PLCT1_02478 [Planctomycetaceae bacterium]